MSLQYLEDFLVYTEEIPQIFCDHLTRVRELDLEARNREDRTRQLKSSLSLRMKRDRAGGGPAAGMVRSEEVIKLADEINRELDKIVDICGEKVRIVASLEALMIRFNQRLDEETEKFKLEIEADSPGCTARLEDRANEEMYSHLKSIPPRQCVTNIYSSYVNKRAQEASQVPGADIPSLTAVQLDGDMRLSAHGTLINETWSPDMATQTVSPRNKSRFAQAPCPLEELCHVRLAGSSPSDQPFTVFIPRTKSRRLIDKPKSRGSGDVSAAPPGNSSNMGPSEEVDDETKKYCFCEGLGEGLMVACDNANCIQEWFHGDCVGIKSEADISGKKWYCPNCSETLEKVAAVHRDLGLRPREARDTPGTLKKSRPAKNRRTR